MEGFVAQISDVVMQRLVLDAAARLRELDARVIDAAAVGVGRVTQARAGA